MAEIFGLAAAGIGVAPIALELAKTVKKLKDYCHEVKTARDDIQSFKDEVDVLDAVLAQLDGLDLAECPSDSPSLRRCHELCNKANNTLSSIVTELHDARKTQAKRTQLAFPFRKERVKQLTEKVGTARSTLTLACNVYLLWQTKVQALAQRQMQAEIVALIEAHRDDHGRKFDDLIAEQGAMRQSVLKLETRSLLTRDIPTRKATVAKPPRSNLRHGFAPMAYRIWDVCSILASGGWKRYFRSYRIVDHNTDLAYLAVESGDLTTLQRLICNGEATIYDRNYGDHSLLSWASHRSRPIFYWLLDMGAGTNMDVSEQAAVVFTLLFYTSDLLTVDQTREEAEAVFCNLEHDISDVTDDINNDQWTSAVAALLKPTQQWEPSDLLCVLDNTFGWRGGSSAPRLQSMLNVTDGTKPGSKQWWHYRTDTGESLLHMLAKAYVVRFRTLTGWRGPEAWDILGAYLAEGIRAGADLHVLSDEGLSPFATMCDIDYESMHSGLAEYLVIPMREWLQCVKAHGVDLMQYGAREYSRWRIPSSSGDDAQRMLSFTYGPRVEDWAPVVEHMGDAYAGIFWDMVEHPERQLPGAWEAKDDRTWDDIYFHFRDEMKRQRRGETRAEKIGEPDLVVGADRVALLKIRHGTGFRAVARNIEQGSTS